jgi:hypothetical protein
MTKREWFLQKNCTLLGYCATSSGYPFPTFRDNLSDPSPVLNVEYGTGRLSQTFGKKVTKFTA